MKTFLVMLLLSLSVQSVMAADIQELKNKKIADFFIYTAKNVLTELSNSTDKIDYNNDSISLTELSQFLESSSIEVQNNDLIDNTGSLVDALGTDHKVILSANSWSEFMKAKKDIRLLVLHEVLRMAQINDDNYVHSLKALPTTTSQNTIAPYCNLRVQTTKVVFSSKQFTGVGYTTPVTVGYFTNNSSNPEEAKVNAVVDLEANCVKKGYSYGPENIRGVLMIKNRNVNGFKTNVYEAKLTGTCYKPENVSREKSEQKAEICQKIDLCQNILKETNTTVSEDFDRMSELTSKWKCQ